jgi:O-acetyl-ADP-ribose deacetylase (regulator of RNase III)
MLRTSGLQNHIANHLERLASFSLPASGSENDSDGASSIASRGDTVTTISSQDLSVVNSDGKASYNQDQGDLYYASGSGALAGGAAMAGSLRRDDSRERSEGSAASPPVSVKVKMHNDGRHITLRRLNEEEAAAEREARRKDERDETDLQTVDREKSDYEAGQDNDVLRLISAEALNNLPDSSEQRMDMFLSNKSFGLEADDKPTATLQSPFIREENDSVSTSSLTSAEEQEDEDEYQNEERHEGEGKPPITSPFNVPTLRTLYKSRILVQRDQSFAPDTAYNQLIALWFGDITRLSIDCIVNSGNRAMKMTYSNDTLNHIVHKAAGPGMRSKLKKLGRVKTGGVRLTAGYRLPCQYVIHAARPQYSGAGGAIKSMSILAECYWRALKEAMSHGIRTIAFPCLGAGGCSFPSGVAARIALQEVRRFLDTHKNHGFDKLVFCVYDETNDKAYKDLLPVFFPPTHRDLEKVASADAAPQDHGFLVARLQDILKEGMCPCDLRPMALHLPECKLMTLEQSSISFET